MDIISECTNYRLIRSNEEMLLEAITDLSDVIKDRVDTDYPDHKIRSIRIITTLEPTSS